MSKLLIGKTSVNGRTSKNGMFNPTPTNGILISYYSLTLTNRNTAIDTVKKFLETISLFNNSATLTLII